MYRRHSRGNSPLAVPGCPPAHAGDKENIIEEEEAAILSGPPWAGTGSDEILSDQPPPRRHQVVVRKAVYNELQLAQLLLSALLLHALLLHGGYVKRKLVNLALRPGQQWVVRVVGLSVLQQALQQPVS